MTRRSCRVTRRRTVNLLLVAPIHSLNHLLVWMHLVVMMYRALPIQTYRMTLLQFWNLKLVMERAKDKMETKREK